MKRSDAVILIANEIEGYGNMEQAEEILKKLEEAGMLPPTSVLKPLNTIDNAWEPE